MMPKFTKQLRQQIVEEFSRRHNGTFNPNLFFKEVAKAGVGHPAYAWFEWDRDKAAYQHNLEQARDFARDLRVSFTIEEVGRNNAIRVRAAEMPLVLSPMSGRRDGGGYYLSDPNDPVHMQEHCRQAANALRSWINRYSSALNHAGGSLAGVQEAVAVLEAASPPNIAAA